MGFFRKKKHNIDEEAVIENSTDFEPDDFDEPETDISREDFHKMAEDALRDAMETGDIESVTVSADEVSAENNIKNEDITNDTDDETDTDDINAEDITDTDDTNSEDTTSDNTDISTDGNATAEEMLGTDDADGSSDALNLEFTANSDSEDDFFDADEEPLPDTHESENAAAEDEPAKKKKKEKKEKKPRMTFSEFRQKYRKAIKAVCISLCSLLAVCLVLYIYGCATIPVGVMGRNIYIENVDVSNLTYEQALAKVKSTSLLNGCDLTLTCKGKTYKINGLDVGLSARIEDTVDKAMRYGKTGNTFIDGFANALQLVVRHTVMPSANVNETILRSKLEDFGNILYGELEQHKLEVGDDQIICTPGHTGFSGDTNTAYSQVIEAINNENFSRIRVDLDAASPKDLTIEDVDAFAYANPQDAYFEVANNSATVVPEVWGRYLDIDAARPLVEQIREGGDVVYIPFQSSEPTVKAADLNQKLFNATLGSFYTSFGGSSANRAANVTNAASKINGKVLAPGEVFSFNDTVGKRTVANGFHQAPEYANGQTVMGIGGGTCQVSSTLYNAVLYSDLAIVSRLNHMFPVGYCPLGQDATVSDSGVDFKFSNNTDYPIKLSAVTGGGRVTISVIGTAREVPQTVKIENYTSFSNGNRSVRSYRMVYDSNGTLLRKEELPKSYYMAH